MARRHCLHFPHQHFLLLGRPCPIVEHQFEGEVQYLPLLVLPHYLSPFDRGRLTHPPKETTAAFPSSISLSPLLFLLFLLFLLTLLTLLSSTTLSSTPLLSNLHSKVRTENS